MNKTSLPEHLLELATHIDHYGRCCAQNASWSTSNRTPTAAALEEWSAVKARKVLVQAIMQHLCSVVAEGGDSDEIDLPPLPSVLGGGYSARQLQDMLEDYATAAVVRDRQRRHQLSMDFNDLGANI